MSKEPEDAPATHPAPDFDTLKAFLVARYKHDRLYGRGDEYGDTVVRSRLDDLARHGVDVISHFESRTGEAVWYRFEGGELKACEAPTRAARAASQEGAQT